MPGDLKFREYVPSRHGVTKAPAQRQRHCVPEEGRQRVRVACQSCAQRKEKCDGHMPCGRCRSERRPCSFAGKDATRKQRQRVKLTSAERLAHFRTVLAHLLDGAEPTDERLVAFSESIRHGQDTEMEKQKSSDIDRSGLGKGRSRETSGAIGSERHRPDNSLSAFSRELETKLGRNEGGLSEGSASEFCQSPLPPDGYCPELDTLVESLPAERTGRSLVTFFFDYVQCNSYCVQEQWATDMLRRCYERQDSLSEREVDAVATTCMMMALGTQFCSMAPQQPHETWLDRSRDMQTLGAQLCSGVLTALPVLIRISSFESSRAIMLLALYFFPIDLAGQAYSYLGLAIHTATRDRAHSKAQQDAVETEVNRRVWWSLYGFYQRARIFHGHPKTFDLAQEEVSRPQWLLELDGRRHPSNFRNQGMLIEITLLLESISDEIAELRAGKRKMTKAPSLLLLRQRCLTLREELPQLAVGETPNTDVHRLRLDVHLCLFYWNAPLALGRPFLLRDTSQPPDNPEQSPADANNLATEAVAAAQEIIRLCKTIQDRIGLASASYATEFTSCRAAMLVLIAASISQRMESIEYSLKEGLDMLEQMSTSYGQASSEAQMIRLLQRAIARLHGQLPSNVRADGKGDTLQQWTQLWYSDSVSPGSLIEQEATGTSVSSVDVTPTQKPSALQGEDPPLSDFIPDDDRAWTEMIDAQLREFDWPLSWEL